MPIIQLRRFIALLLCVLLAGAGFAQETEENASPAAPDLRSLQSDWWAYFEGSRSEVEPRIETFLDQTGAQIADLATQNQRIAETLLEAVRDNLAALLPLLDDAELKPLQSPELAAGYSIDQLLELAASARAAQAAAAEEQLEVDREQRILTGTSRHRDATFDDYVDVNSGDERWLAGLRLLQARSAMAISTRRLELLTQRYEHNFAYADALAALAESARDRLSTTADEANLRALNERVDNDNAAVEAAQERTARRSDRREWP